MEQPADHPWASRDGLGAARAAEEAVRDEAYRAIGHYTVQFSLLVFAMRRIWSGHIAQDDPQRRELLELSFGESGAYAIAEAFFAMCKEVGGLDTAEDVIWSKLRNAVKHEITERNNIVHGDWLIGFWTSTAGQPEPPKLVRIKASSQAKPFDQRDLTADELSDAARRVEDLANVVWQFGLACTRLGSYWTRVSEAIHMTSEGDLIQPEGSVWGLPNPHGP